MTTKHLIALAQGFHDIPMNMLPARVDQHTLNVCIKNVITVASRFNPRFDAQKFLIACNPSTPRKVTHDEVKTRLLNRGNYTDTRETLTEKSKVAPLTEKQLTDYYRSKR